MELTKYTHACLLLEKGITKILFDPGVFTTDQLDLNDIHAVVITHQHQDHLDQNKLKQVFQTSPQAMIYTVRSVADKLGDFGSAVHIVEPGDVLTVGDFSLMFVGGKHARIFKNLDQIENIGVIVNDLLFVPGDSYFVPEQKPAWLALPLNAPWARLEDTVEFLKAMQPKHSFAIHNGLLSEAGYRVYSTGLPLNDGTVWHDVMPGQTIQVTAE